MLPQKEFIDASSPLQKPPAPAPTPTWLICFVVLVIGAALAAVLLLDPDSGMLPAAVDTLNAE